MRPAVPLHLPQKRAHGAAACASPAASLLVLAALCACSAPFPACAPLLRRWLLWSRCSAHRRLPAFSCFYGFGVLQPLLRCCGVHLLLRRAPTHAFCAPAPPRATGHEQGGGAACVWVLQLRGGCGVCAGATARGDGISPCCGLPPSLISFQWVRLGGPLEGRLGSEEVALTSWFCCCRVGCVVLHVPGGNQVSGQLGLCFGLRCECGCGL